MNERSFILKNIENFLNFEFHPTSISQTLALKPAAEWIEFCKTECHLGIIKLKSLRYQFSALDFNRYIQLTYADTGALIDCARNYELSILNAHLPEELSAFYPDLIASLDPVILYIERNIDGYDPTALLPEYQLKQEMEFIRQQSLVLKAKCKSREIDPALQKILNELLDAALQLKSCSYQVLFYLKKLISSLLDILAKTGTSGSNMAVIKSLVASNFNDHGFYDYCKLHLGSLVGQEQQLEEQCSALRFHIKEIKSLLTKPNLAMNPEGPNLKTLLLQFLQAELEYRELETVGRPNTVLPIKEFQPLESPSRLKLNTNMRQLAISINILTQLGIFVLEKSGIKGILSFFVAHVSTLGKESLSIDSLQKRVSEKNTAAALGLLKVLEEMIVILKRDYLS